MPDNTEPVQPAPEPAKPSWQWPDLASVDWKTLLWRAAYVVLAILAGASGSYLTSTKSCPCQGDPAPDCKCK
jgi:hypothetical protein